MTQLILLPGLASNAVMWQHQLTHLSAELPVRVSDVNTRYDRIEAMASAVLEEHSGQLILCGASMGGMVAMEVLRQAPQRVCAAALLGTSARPETEDMRRLREAAILLFEAGRSAEVLRANVPLAFHASHARNSALTGTYLDFVLAAGVDQLVRQNRAVMARPDARQHLPSANCPVLVMCGDSDQLTPPDCSHEIAALVPGAQLMMVGQCGHMLTMEQPEFVTTCLRDWLRVVNVAAA